LALVQLYSGSDYCRNDPVHTKLFFLHVLFPNLTIDLTKTGSGQTQGKFKQTSVVRRMHWRFVPPRKTQRRQEGTAGTQTLLLLPAAAVARARRQVRSAACLKFVMKSDHGQPRQARDKRIRENSNKNVAFVFAQACR
jgi:hypothetical protein